MSVSDPAPQVVLEKQGAHPLRTLAAEAQEGIVGVVAAGAARSGLVRYLPSPRVQYVLRCTWAKSVKSALVEVVGIVGGRCRLRAGRARRCGCGRARRRIRWGQNRTSGMVRSSRECELKLRLVSGMPSLSPSWLMKDYHLRRRHNSELPRGRFPRPSGKRSPSSLSCTRLQGEHTG